MIQFSLQETSQLKSSDALAIFVTTDSGLLLPKTALRELIQQS